MLFVKGSCAGICIPKEKVKHLWVRVLSFSRVSVFPKPAAAIFADFYIHRNAFKKIYLFIDLIGSRIK